MRMTVALGTKKARNAETRSGATRPGLDQSVNVNDEGNENGDEELLVEGERVRVVVEVPQFRVLLVHKQYVVLPLRIQLSTRNSTAQSKRKCTARVAGKEKRLEAHSVAHLRNTPPQHVDCLSLEQKQLKGHFHSAQPIVAERLLLREEKTPGLCIPVHRNTGVDCYEFALVLDQKTLCRRQTELAQKGLGPVLLYLVMF